MLELEFYAFTPYDGFEYEMTTNVSEDDGYLVRSPNTRISKDFSVVSEFRDTIALEYRLGGFRYSWETSTYDEYGDVVARPTVELDINRLLVSDPVFGVMRVRGSALGDTYRLYINIPVTQTHQVRNIKPVATATWFEDGIEQKTSLQITVPDCVYDSLNPCPDGSVKSYVIVEDQGDRRYAVIYNGCNGRLFEVREL